MMKIVEKIIKLSGEEQDKDIIIYGLQILWDGMVTIVVIMVLGFLYGKVGESTLYLLFGFFGTSTLGGYHCKTRLRCLIFTVFFWFLSIVFLGIMEIYVSQTQASVLSSIMTLIVFTMAPAEHDNKPLSRSVYMRNKVISIAFNLFITIWVSLAWGENQWLSMVLLINQIEIVISMILGKGGISMLKQKGAKAVTRLAKKVAYKTANDASVWMHYQPKEPNKLHKGK